MKRLVLSENVVLLAFMFSVFFLSALSGQELSREELENQSVSYLKEGKNELALQGFESLLEVYPDDAAYNYYAGICYLNQGGKLEKSVESLRIGAAKNYKVDVHFYLFLANLRMYEFEQAELSLINFKNLASKKEEKKFKVKLWEEALIQLKKETKKVQVPVAGLVKELKMPHVEYAFPAVVNGKFIYKPAEFMSDADRAVDYQGIMFISNEKRNNKILVVPGQGKKKKGIDLFVIEQISSQKFKAPVAITTVNTKYDEEYPYFDQRQQVLYFSSNRAGGLGGYDIYKSTYNEGTKTFSVPVRLKFPYNTPFDDYLYIPDSTNKTAVLVTNRHADIRFFNACEIQPEGTQEVFEPKTREEICNISALKATNYPEGKVEAEESKPRKPVKKFKTYSEYEVLLEQAMEMQLECDSLQSELVNYRSELQEVTVEEERQKLKNRISQGTQLVKKMQAEADKLFAEAHQVRSVSNELSVEDNEGKDEHVYQINEINGIKVFAYKTEDGGGEMEHDREPAYSSETKFQIQSKSPYSEENPIPNEVEYPEGLVYRIQLGVFGNNLTMDTFGGLTPMSSERIEGGRLTRYFVGWFSVSREARKAINRVKEYGYSDAFIVPYYNGNKITIHDAREIEFGEKK